MQNGQLFLGTTTSPAREFASQVIAAHNPERLFLPCVGRFAACAACVAAGVKPERIWASDVSLFSSMLGYLADPSKQITDLPISPGPIERFVQNADDEVEWVAGAMLGVYLHNLQASNLFAQAQKVEVMRNLDTYRDQLTEQVRSSQEQLNGIHYDIADFRDVVETFSEGKPTDALYVNPPGYAQGYTKMYGAAEELLAFDGVATSELNPAEVPILLERLDDGPGLAVCYVHHGRDDAPEHWEPIMAIEVDSDRIDYLVASQPVDARMAVPNSRRAKPPRVYPIYADEEITTDTEIAIIQVDVDTCLYYRDLFVHKLGQAKAEMYFLFLIDGRVSTAFGLHARDLRMQKSRHLGEVFGISRTSRRYKRLGKLFMMALTSGSMLQLTMRNNHQFELYPPRGIKTSSLTTHPEGKTDRGVMKLTHREQLPNGNYRVVYEGDFRDDTWADVLEVWLEKHGHYVRPGFAPTTESETADG